MAGLHDINGARAGLELFAAASTWRTLAPKPVRSYAIDALDRRHTPSQNRAPHAHIAFATAVEATPTSVFPAVGQGIDVRINGLDVTGAALVANVVSST
jgi:hypothetical protein